MISIAIIILCIIAYAIQLAYPAVTPAFAFIPAFALAEPWRFITSMFLHDPDDLTHLLLNMFVLLMFGPYLERKVGQTRFVAIYLFSGILGSVGVLLLNSPYTLGYGASGAIYGIMGALMLLEPKMKVYVYFIPTSIVVATVLFAAIDLISMGSHDNIAHAAHLFGLVGGLALAYVYKQMDGASEWS